MNGREWLRSQGIAVGDRGRLSAEHRAMLAEAGVKESTPEECYDVFFRFPESEFMAIEPSGKQRSMREACNTCGYSLTGHICEDPRIVTNDGRGNVQVTIVRKK